MLSWKVTFLRNSWRPKETVRVFLFNLFSLSCYYMDLSIKALVTDAAVEDQESHRMFDESSSDSSPGGDTAVKFGETEDGKVGDTEGPVNQYFQNVKKSVVEMVSNVSDFFQNLAERAPLMGLAIAVITVVVLKRV